MRYPSHITDLTIKGATSSLTSGKFHADVSDFFAPLWPGSTTQITAAGLVEDPVFPKGFFLLIPEKWPITIILLGMVITHPNGLKITYNRATADKQIIDPPDIRIAGAGKVSNIDLQRTFPLLNLLRDGNVEQHTDSIRRRIVAEWFNTGQFGNEAQEKFAAQYDVTGRTLRRWIKTYGRVGHK